MTTRASGIRATTPGEALSGRLPALPAASRRGFLAASGAGLAFLATSRPALALPSVQQQLDRLCERLWQDQLRRFPAQATSLGADNLALRGRLDDWSRDGREDWIDWAGDASRRLATVEASVLDRDLKLDHTVLSDHFGRIARLGRRWRFGDAAAAPHAPVAPYALSPVNGPHQAVPRLLTSEHPLAVADDCEAWLARLAAFAGALDAATAAFLEDAGAGVMAPATALASTLDQLGGLRRPEPAAHPLAITLAARAAAAGIPGEWGARAAMILARSTYPALDRQVAALTRAMASAPAADGAAQLPDGRAFYADALGFHTGTALTPAEVHRLGLDRIDRLNAELEPLLRRLGMTSGPIGARLAALEHRPGERFTDCAEGRAAVAQAFSAAIACAQGHLAENFPVRPAAPREVRFAETSGAPAPASHGGTLWLDSAEIAQWPRHAVPTSAFCQGMAGPRWEAAGAKANPELPAIRRHGTRYPAFAAGWTLYAEHTATTTGLYEDDPAARAGYLQARLLHAARLVADTGLHDLGWSAGRAAATLTEVAGRSPECARADVARAALLPGEACAEGVGESEWRRLRALAERLAGPTFDAQRFNALIGHGRAPFAVLDEVVTEAFNPRLSVLGMRTV